MSEAKNGNSIWSLMVITTMFAVWFAIPRRVSGVHVVTPEILTFFIVHLGCLLSLIAALIWLLAGKRPWIVYLGAFAIGSILGPATFLTFELWASGQAVATNSILYSVGLHEEFFEFYNMLFNTLGYQ